MKKSTRFAILGIAIQVFLFALMLTLMATIGVSSAETARRITNAYGWLAGPLAAFFAVVWFQEWKRGP